MKLRGAILMCLLLAMLVLSACGQSETPPAEEEVSVVDEPTAVAEAEATETAQPETEMVEEPVDPEEEVDPEKPTPAPVSEVTSENCLACHGDKEQLIETAAPEPEETESSESSGVG